MGNFDEFFIDMNDFSGKKAIFVDDTSNAHVIVPYELAPHLTGLWGFSGPKMLDLVIIGIGKSGVPPKIEHLELCAGHEPRVLLAQSENGWITNDLKRVVVDEWINSDSTSFGSEPSVMTADGHKSNTEQLEIIELMRKAEALFGVTPAHCTAKGLQQLDLPNGLISRFKKFFRKYMRKLCRESLKKTVPKHLRGRILYSKILRAAQMAAQKATSAAANIAENKKVGYYIDALTGYLQYKPLASVNASFFDTSAAFGGGGATGGDADIVLVRNSTQAKVAAAVAEARERVRAVVGVVDHFEAPIMDEPTQVPGRKRKSMTAAGAIINSTEYEAELRAQKSIAEDKETAKKTKREAKVTDFAAKWVPLVQKAEAALAALKPIPTTAAALSAALKVGDLKALIVSRSGKTAAAKNNKEDALAKEALALLSKPQVTMAAAAAAADDSSDDSSADEIDDEEK